MAGFGVSIDWLVGRAIIIATEAHLGQRDKVGELYIFHALRVMMKGKTYQEKILGVLHDVVEDTAVTLEMIDDQFPSEITAALDAISHRDHEPNVDYLTRVCANSLAKIVKGYDLDDNSDPVRMAGLDEETRNRLKNKHMMSYDYLGGRREFPKGTFSGGSE